MSKKKIKYEYITDKMLESIDKQRRGSEDRFILEKLSEKNLKRVERFILSFSLIEENNIEKFAEDVGASVIDRWWKS